MISISLFAGPKTNLIEKKSDAQSTPSIQQEVDISNYSGMILRPSWRDAARVSGRKVLKVTSNVNKLSPQESRKGTRWQYESPA